MRYCRVIIRKRIVELWRNRVLIPIDFQYCTKRILVESSSKALTTIRTSIIELRFDVIRIGCKLRSYLFVHVS